MQEDLARTYRRAKLAATIGSVSMFVLFGAFLLILAVFLFAFLKTGSFDDMGLSWKLLSLACMVARTLSVLLLAEFLRHFSAGKSPFGRRQSARLLVSGALLALDAVLGYLAYAAPVTRQVSDAVAATTHGGPSLTVVVMIVFILSLAAVIRYGDALKRDSDSIA